MDDFDENYFDPPTEVVEAVIEVLGETPDRWIGFAMAQALHTVMFSMLLGESSDDDVRDDVAEMNSIIVLHSATFTRMIEAVMSTPVGVMAGQALKTIVDDLGENWK